MRKIEADLGLNRQIVKGETIPVRNCWHFSTDGNDIDVIFYDEQDFVDGMNRIFVVLASYNIIILAFCLMDNHVHFVLYGSFEDCNRFVHEYVRRTSMHIAKRHSDHNKLANVHIDYQPIGDDLALKRFICYVLKNPTKARLPYLPCDYPWSSGPLYFRNRQTWAVPAYQPDLRMYDSSSSSAPMPYLKKRIMLKTHTPGLEDVMLWDGLVDPAAYVAVDIVERLFYTCRSFTFFMGSTKDEEVESRGGIISRLSIPDSELRQYRNEIVCQLFGLTNPHSLNTQQRIHLARTLHAKYNCSAKQIARVSGLIYNEVKDLI